MKNFVILFLLFSPVAHADWDQVADILRGGTNTNTQTSGGVCYYNGTKLTTGSTFQFNGTEVGIGTSPSTASDLTLAAGTSSVAPLKLTAGTNLTVPLNGAIEYDGTNLYLTNGSGRQTVYPQSGGGSSSWCAISTWATGTNTWSMTASTSYGPFPAQSPIGNPTIHPSGALTTPSTVVPEVIIPSVAPGVVTVEMLQSWSASASGALYTAIYDANNSIYGGDNSYNGLGGGTLIRGSFYYSTSQTNLTLEVVGKDSVGGRSIFLGQGNAGDIAVMTVCWSPGL